MLVFPATTPTPSFGKEGSVLTAKPCVERKLAAALVPLLPKDGLGVVAGKSTHCRIKISKRTSGWVRVLPQVALEKVPFDLQRRFLRAVFDLLERARVLCAGHFRRRLVADDLHRN